LSAGVPRKSAVVIPVTRAGGELRVLVGRRSPRSRFLGGFFAFPGGAHEPADGDPRGAGEDDALRRTAARELEEETGLSVAPDALLPAGRRVTPPFGPRRFDAAMYVSVHDAAVEPRPTHPGELLDMEWVLPDEMMARWRSLAVRIAPPLIPMLQDLADGSDRPFPDLARSLRERNDAMEAEGPHIEFVPDVLTLLLRTPTLPPATHTNCYVVGEEEVLIVDPGSADASERARVARTVARRVEPGGKARAVVLTHHHGDHVGGALALARELGNGVWAHAATWDRWPEGSALRGGAGSRELEDGEVVALSGGERFRVLHTPGHAAGHVALLEERRGSLFSGDLVSGVSTVLVDSAPGSMAAYLRSLERIRDAGARTLFPGHGFPFIDPAKGVQHVIDHRLAREARILEALSEGPQALAEIVRRAYDDTPQANPTLAAAQAASHLEHLESLGRVRRDRERFVRS
jgi:glyoxylase-like metal-dependent hydrolase (beta-lactamase superfamily II)/8-oxo-dGTP pyrophosphatase MutT (NUDIX family)